MVWKESSSLYKMTIGHPQPIAYAYAYVPPCHPLGYHLNVGNIYLKKSGNFAQWCQDLTYPDPAKENTPPTPEALTDF